MEDNLLKSTKNEFQKVTEKVWEWLKTHKKLVGISLLLVIIYKYFLEEE